MQKYILFEHKAPEPSHILQIYITFAEIFENRINVM